MFARLGRCLRGFKGRQRAGIDAAKADGIWSSFRTAWLENELGYILFCAFKLARHLNIDPEAALRSTNAKFDRQFQFIEAALARNGRSVKKVSLDEMGALWQAAKEKKALPP